MPNGMIHLGVACPIFMFATTEILGLSITSTIIFCTYTLIDEIRKLKD